MRSIRSDDYNIFRAEFPLQSHEENCCLLRFFHSIIPVDPHDQLLRGEAEGTLGDVEGGVGARAEAGAGVEGEEEEVALTEELARVGGDDAEVGEEESAGDVNRFDLGPGDADSAQEGQVTQGQPFSIGVKGGPAVGEQAYGGPAEAKEVDGADQIEQGEEYKRDNSIGARTQKDRDDRLADNREDGEAENKDNCHAHLARLNIELGPRLRGLGNWLFIARWHA